MPDGTFAVKVVTPEEVLVSAQARALMVKSTIGDFTVLDGHTPVVTDIVPSEVRVVLADESTERLAVHGGFLQVETGRDLPDGDAGGEAEGVSAGEIATRATLLAGVAERAGAIDVARAEAARELAQGKVDRLRAAGARATTGEAEVQAVSPEAIELAESEAALSRATLRLEVAEAR